ncbi:expressed unknown protein [Seminavis robusta]|uniref:Uncharacterized protein n=1 Tax=Seminavis robusta TaxID=568900 RepID=A0A9N8HWU7_9STRA|nr:expressed unknown protein [Seminavis robusta]|eukprot:Sro2276_g321670.1 n/a (562) ;mRNA; r:12225-14001
MSTYYGFLSYPHGGRASAFLLLSMACGTICTCFAVSTCRFATLEFLSDHGDFDQHFVGDTDAKDTLSSVRVGIGLFVWMRPFDTLDWDDGSCAGYNELQRNVIVDGRFEILRIVGVVAVLMSVSLFLFSFGLSCLSLARLQRYIMITCTVALAFMTGSTLLITTTSVCTDIGTYPNCDVDQGGLVAVAGVLFWILTGLIMVFFIQPVQNTKLSNRQKEKRKTEIRKKQLNMLKQIEELDLDRRLAERKLREQEEGTSSLKRKASQTSEPSQKQLEQKRQTQQPTQQQPQTQRRQRKPQKCIVQVQVDAEPPKALPRRSESWQQAENEETSPESTSPQSTISQRIPEVLPLNKNQQLQSPPVPARKHKQLESPKMSPQEANQRKSTKGMHSLQIYEAEAGSPPDVPTEDVEAIYTRRAQPVKKRRLRGSSQEPPKHPPPRRTQRDAPAGKRTQQHHRRRERRNEIAEQERRSSSKRDGSELSDPLYGCFPPPLPVPRANSRKTQALMCDLPLFDISTVVSHDQSDTEDVEVYIGKTLDKIDTMIDIGSYEGSTWSSDWRADV